MPKHDDIEWGKMTRNIQYKEAPSIDRSQVKAPKGFWVDKDSESEQFKDLDKSDSKSKSRKSKNI